MIKSTPVIEDTIILRSAELAGQGGDFVIDTPGIHTRVVLFRETAPESVRLKFHLRARGAELKLIAAFMGTGAMRSRIDCTVSHDAPGTKVRVLFKAVLRDQSRVDFSGMLYIAKGADGSDSYLNARALMLSAHAIARIDPRLEILADDIKASHGSTVGRLAEENLFYLQSRGFGLRASERILLRGYFSDVLKEVPARIAAEIEKNL